MARIALNAPLRVQIAYKQYSEAAADRRSMTAEEAEAINQAAEFAAESALDAFGAAEVPPAHVAWNFLNEMVYGDDQIERPAGLPTALTRQFKHDYRRHVQRLADARR